VTRRKKRSIFTLSRKGSKRKVKKRLLRKEEEDKLLDASTISLWRKRSFDALERRSL